MLRNQMEVLLLITFCLGVLGTVLLGAEKTPPDKLVFEAKLGNVTFDHAKHVEREANKCEACHDSLFPQSRDPINYGKAMHKPAEASKSSCAGCHHDGGKAFATKGKCKTCHIK